MNSTELDLHGQIWAEALEAFEIGERELARSNGADGGGAFCGCAAGVRACAQGPSGLRGRRGQSVGVRAQGWRRAAGITLAKRAFLLGEQQPYLTWWCEMHGLSAR